MSAEPPSERPSRTGPTVDPHEVSVPPLFSEGLIPIVRDHPWITAIMLATTLGGAAAGPWLFEADWSLARQIGAGAFCGAWVGITITVTKMIGD